ncbi:MAG TPA: oligoendopeptidase F [Clostridia bacterium]|nr:oligoendopeptidase F [Clostridia bacterium]
MMKNNFFRTVAVIMTIVMVMSVGLVFAEDTGIPKRSDIAEQYKWKLEDMYADKDAFEKDFAKVQKEYIPKVTQYKGKLNSAAVLLECLKLCEEMGMTMEKLYVYAHMKLDVNKADNEVSEMSSRTETLQSNADEAASFIEPELLAKSEELLRKDYINSPILKDYKYYLTVLLNKKAHILSDAEEQILAQAGDMSGSPEAIYGQLIDVDLQYPSMKGEDGNEVQLTYGQFSRLRANANRDIRKEACEKHMGAYLSVQNTFAATLNAQVKNDIFFARARKYNSALEAAVTGNNNIPVSVYDNLVKAVNGNVGQLHKYITLKKNVLGIDKVHYHDLYPKLVDDYEMKIPYEDGKKMILEGLKPMGQEYIKNLQTAFNSNWIDVYETENKYTGGYQWGSYNTHPYILLNYDDSPEEMLTVAHELGHAMHTYYTNANQKYLNSEYPTFTAEVASTTNEFIMTQYLIDHARDNKEKLFLINLLAENIRSTVYTQIMYAEFEKAIHERVEKGEALSADTLKTMWKELMEKYFGEDFVVDEYATMWWSYIPHFYMNFYVYNYATGMAAAYPLSQAILKGERGAVDKYIGFLKSGNSDNPVEILKKAGVDMNSTKPVDDLLKLFGDLVDQMEQILREEDKIK